MFPSNVMHITVVLNVQKAMGDVKVLYILGDMHYNMWWCAQLDLLIHKTCNILMDNPGFWFKTVVIISKVFNNNLKNRLCRQQLIISKIDYVDNNYI